MSNGESTVSLCAVGDIRIMRDKDPEKVLELVAPIMRNADITFAQLEGDLAEKGSPQGGYANVMMAPPSSVKGLTYAGIDVVSVAGNHSGDYRPEALLESMEWLRQNGVQPVGAGSNLKEAREPVIFEKKGTKVAFLAYVSVIPWGLEAGPKRPGPAPIRVSTYYRQMDWQPGTPPLVVTIPDPEDAENMKEDIRSVRERVDYIVVSIHWGIHNVPVELADYEPVVWPCGCRCWRRHGSRSPRARFEGHRAIQRKAHFYCLGDFSVATKYREGYEDYQHTVDKLFGREADPACTFHSPISSEHQKKSIIVKWVIRGNKLRSLRLTPCHISPQVHPYPVDPVKERNLWDEWIGFVTASCRGVGCDTELNEDGDAVLVRL